MTDRDFRELDPAANEGLPSVPQVMTRRAGDFLWAAEQCAQRGYDEVNLNIGCPSGTVVSKGKGSGMLRDVDALDRFLDEIFQGSPLPISVKTRLGLERSEEFPAILDVLNRYPIKELTIHPRTRKQFYDGKLHMDMFGYALQNSKHALCFNGEIRSKIHIFGILHEFLPEEYPQVEAVMIGRGLVGDPGMLLPGGTEISALEAFHDELLETYTDVFGGSRNAMFRLKENWHFLITHFEGSEKLWKQLRKTTDLAQYRSIVAQIFHTLPFHS